MQKSYLALIFILILFSCKKEKNIKNETNFQADSLNLHYAELFSVKYFERYTELTVFSENKTQKIKYYLVNKNSNIPQEIKNENIIFTPVNKVVCMSTTHVAFINLLGENESIKGISGANYIYDKEIKNRIKNSKIFDAGYEQSTDYETIIKLQPDFVTVYNVDGEVSGIITKLKSLNIPVVQINEYSEKNILGQTEWLKFFAEFYNKTDFAKTKCDSIFLRYNNLKNKALNCKSKPKVMLNLPWQGVWYIPGNKSNVAQLINDAGGNYKSIVSDNMRNFPADIAEVYVKWADTDFWLNPGDINFKNQISETDNRLTMFKPFKNGNIYNRNKRADLNGGNDYMESGIVNPDIILEDIIKIIHPEILKPDSTYYYKKIR